MADFRDKLRSQISDGKQFAASMNHDHETSVSNLKTKLSKLQDDQVKVLAMHKHLDNEKGIINGNSSKEVKVAFNGLNKKRMDIAL